MKNSAARTDTRDISFNIRCASAREARAEMCAVWRDCFPSDGERDAELFCRLSDADVLLLTCGGELAGSCGIVPISAGKLRGGYIYAMGVLKSFRGNGGMTLLLCAAQKYAAAHGLDFLSLVPADRQLCRTYERHGYGGRVEIPRFEIADTAALRPIRLPPPCPTERGVIVPCTGFVNYIRASYREYDLDGAGLVCGEAQNGVREVFEYIPNIRAEDKTAPISRIPAPAAGMILPLTQGAEALRIGHAFYCSMGE